MGDNAKQEQGLTPGAQRLVEMAERYREQGRQAPLGAHHWLLALVERHGGMAEALAPGLKAAALGRQIMAQLQQGQAGKPLATDTVVEQAVERARARGKPQASERDLAAVILGAAGYTLAEEPRAFPVRPEATGPSPEAPAPAYRPRTTRATPTLERFGRDLTREARDGKLSPVVGRDAEIQVVIETLCRRTKRNPVLVGPAGVGKTAIVEGLAQRIVQGEVPEALHGVRLLAVQPSALVAGAGVVGELEKRMQAVLGEASQEGLLLFIDEVHAVVGAGGREGTSDIASLLKPALARGDFACIAATTDDEYRRYIEPDAALERRFQPIRVQELTAEQTLHVLHALRAELARLRGVQVPEAVLAWLVDFAQRFLRNRHFPDKAIDLLEQCVAYAVTQGKHAVEQADAEAVAQRLVGMPVAVATGVETLRQDLAARALLPDDAVQALCHRLEVTLRGLDLQPARPNAVLLLLDAAAVHGEALAATVAAAVYGAAERVIRLDCGRFGQPADLTMLLGAPPGYVGYSQALPMHRLAQMPWCVVCWENLHACHPQIRDVLTQALADGFLTDASGKRLYLSDAVVLLTATTAVTSRRLGFHQVTTAPAEAARQLAVQALGAALVAQVDLVCAEVPASAGARRRWLEQQLLAELAERYRRQGMVLHWDESLVEWLLQQHALHASPRDWERFVDEELSPRLIRYLPERGQQRTLTVSYRGGSLHLEPGGEGGA